MSKGQRGNKEAKKPKRPAPVKALAPSLSTPAVAPVTPKK